jgi:hypothetical protein
MRRVCTSVSSCANTRAHAPLGILLLLLPPPADGGGGLVSSSAGVTRVAGCVGPEPEQQEDGTRVSVSVS